MATSVAEPELTFRNYSAKQAQAYADSRPTYPKNLISHIITSHQSTGGSLNTVLDLGCGPGNATRDLAAHFNHAFGLDPSAEMISAAREIGGEAKESRIQYLLGEAETCEGIPDGSVDLITAGTSAHWFDMQRFWPTAARILKPNGTAAIFIIYNNTLHPDTPHKEEIEKITHELGRVTLQPYKMHGNNVARENYATMPLPWDVDPPVEAFEKERFVRKVWNEGGKPEEDGTYFAGVLKIKLSDVEKRYGTSSSVTRWRDAHPEIAGTDKDVIKIAFKKVEALFGDEDEKEVSFVGTTTLLFLKRT